MNHRSTLRPDSLFRRGTSAFLRCSGLFGTNPFIVVVIAAAVLCVGLFYVWTRMQIVEIGYEISSLENKSNELKKRKRELLLEITSQQSPQELEAKAGKIGLVFPAMGKVVHVP